MRNIVTLPKILLLIILFSSCTSKNPIENTRKIVSECSALVENESTLGIAIGIEVDTMIRAINEYGLSNYSTKEPLSTNAKFRIASITKPLTATAILQLVESKH